MVQSNIKSCFKNSFLWRSELRYLVTVNAIVPSILAGNSVILKQAPQTPLCAERYAQAFEEAGLPDGVFNYIHMDNETCDMLISTAGNFDFVQFTGSVRGGREIVKGLCVILWVA